MKPIKNIAGYTLIAISIVTIIGAAVYRLYVLNARGTVLTLFLSAAALIFVNRFRPKNGPTVAAGQRSKTSRPKNKSILRIGLSISYFPLLSWCIFILISRQTTAAIISPWQVVPNRFFFFYALLTAIALLIINQKTKIANLALIAHYSFSFSAALIIYKIGFGFDPFIHRATVALIDKIGTVEPKPLYYLGQYALIVILHKITFIPLVWLDKLLVPLLAGIFLPLTVIKSLKNRFSRNNALLTALLALIIPFPFFIVTTPQNLAYLFLLLAIISGLACKNIFDLIVVYLFSLAALASHPIAGIPAVLFALIITVYYSDSKKNKRYLYGLFFILTVIALPLALWFVNRILPRFGAQKAFANHDAPAFLSAIIPGQENFILNFIYLYAFNLKILTLALILTGIFIACRGRQQCRVPGVYLIMSAALCLSYFLAKFLPFYFLIDYERSYYTDRILLISALFAAPFIFLFLSWFIDKIKQQNNFIKISFAVFAVLLITASLYISYPRSDRYYNSRGYSVGQGDILAVRWIESTAKNHNYIVLADQQVSAAALSQFGFKKYYRPKSNQQPPIFYYPIPTGGPLYQYYLDMVYKKPGRATMLDAMNLTGVNEAYFVLNKYWWAFPKILAEAKPEADSWQKFDNGAVYVFRYKR